MAKVRLESKENLAQEIHVLSDTEENFVLRADEPKALGGGGTAPAPYDYLLTALAACTSITLRMYADRKAIPLKHVSVELFHEKREDKDGHKIDFIRKDITFLGELSDEQVARLKEIADKCPVNRTLQNSVTIETNATRA